VCFEFSYHFCLNGSHFKKKLTRHWLKIYIGPYVKYPLLLSDFSETWIFSTGFRKILISNLMKTRSVEAEFFHADGLTDMKLTVGFMRTRLNSTGEGGK